MNDPSDFRRPGQLPLQNPDFANPGMFDPYVEHVWSLCDGKTPVDEIVARSRLSGERTLSILTVLRRLGAIVLEGDAPDSVAARVADFRQARSGASGVHILPQPEPQRIARGSSSPPPIVAPRGPLAAGSVNIEPVEPTEPSAAVPSSVPTDPVEFAASDADLSQDEKRAAIAMWRIVGRGDPCEILGVQPGASAAEVHDAFRARCKQFHPDRYYGRNLGSFSRWLGEIFDGIQTAYAKLTSHLSAGKFQTKREHASELFKLGARLEANGQLEDALRLFAAACRVDARPAYLRRAARCALAASDPDRAETWALAAVDIAPTDPSSLRVLADVYCAQDRLVRAEVVLKRAVELATGSESLALELARELARVQRWLRG